VLQPILVRAAGQGFELIAGERRWRAAQRAGIHRIPAIIRDFESAVTAEVALIENIQRQDLNPLEEAQGYRRLIEEHGHTQEQLAAIVHKSRSHVTNMLRLLDLPAPVQEMLLSGALTMGHARALAASPEAEAIATEVVAKGLSVRQTEERVRQAKPGRSRPIETKSAAAVDPDLAALERQLGDLLGLRVRITHNGSGGAVSLSYSSLDQLDMICQRLSGEPI
jgi:ParB family transcriptional regulator, chromosome partitioning protein